MKEIFLRKSSGNIPYAIVDVGNRFVFSKETDHFGGVQSVELEIKQAIHPDFVEVNQPGLDNKTWFGSYFLDVIRGHEVGLQCMIVLGNQFVPESLLVLVNE